MPLFDFLKKKEDPEPPVSLLTRKVVHRARYVNTPAQPVETEAEAGALPEAEEEPEAGEYAEDEDTPEADPVVTRPGRMGHGQSSDMSQPEAGPSGRARGRMGHGRSKAMNLPAGKFSALTNGMKKAGKAVLPRKYLLRPALWDFSSIFSLVMNAVLVAVVLLMAARINTLQNTLNGLLGGLYDNFVRMDRSYITTTVAMQDVPIPLDFILPVVQAETNVTLTRAVTVRNAYVVIDTGQLTINAPATVTLPAGTTLPVSLQMDVPVQTTVLVDLQVPINIELARANSTDPAIANLHTAFLGLQDTIGPLYCLLQPGAVDYLAQPLCNSEGLYIGRTPPTP